MTIKVLEKTEGCMPVQFKQGDWIDLVTAEDVTLKGPYAKVLKKKTKNGEVTERYRDVVFDSTLIPLGVAIQMPGGFEGYLLPRSSTFKKYGLVQTNSQGVIDESYSSDKDEWKMPVMATRAVTIPKGTRIAQMRIQLSQKATMKQKLMWAFSSGIKIKMVRTLSNKERGGFGSTDKQQH